MKSIFLRQLAPFPIRTRMDEMKKYLRRRLKIAAEQMKAPAAKAMAQNRLDEPACAVCPTARSAAQRVTRLLESRDAAFEGSR